jgi:hypothetical protein
MFAISKLLAKCPTDPFQRTLASRGDFSNWPIPVLRFRAKLSFHGFAEALRAASSFRVHVQGRFMALDAQSLGLRRALVRARAFA